MGLFFGRTSLAHPSIIIKKSELDKYHLRYDSAYQYAEDYDLYCRASQYVEFDNYPESLIKYRIHPESVSQKHKKQQITDAKVALYLHLRRLHFPIDIQEFNIHSLLSFPPPKWDGLIIDKVIQWLNYLILWNEGKNLFPCDKFTNQSCFSTPPTPYDRNKFIGGNFKIEIPNYPFSHFIFNITFSNINYFYHISPHF